MDDYVRANELFVDEEYEEALKYYTTAIEETPDRSDYYTKRAACYLKLNKHINALQDANKAIELDPKNSNAHLRKGIAYFEQQEYESAKTAFENALAISDQPQIRRWVRKCDAELELEELQEQSEEEVENEKEKEKEESSTPAAKQEPAKVSVAQSPPAAKSSSTPQSLPDSKSTFNSATIESLPPPTPKIRHEWYQTPTHVVVTIFAKNLSSKEAQISYTKESLSVYIQTSSNSEFVLELNLCDDIIPEESTVQYYSTKVEIKLAKVKQVKWLTLEKSEQPIRTMAWADTSAVDKQVYPSSSKIKKNWDVIAKEVEEEKLEGEQALNQVFKDIYAKGSDEQRRAMMKSFVESGGTVLSTNWKDVGSRKVEGSPPKGADMHTWNELHS